MPRNNKNKNKTSSKPQDNSKITNKRDNDKKTPREYAKGNGHQPRFQKDKDDTADEITVYGKSNDAAWYADNPELVKAYASFPFGQPLGTGRGLVTTGLSPSGNVFTLGDASFPGTMAIYLAPTVGVATSENSAVNLAARNLYSYVRHANSGHSNYESPDLMMYVVAVTQMYSYLHFLKRAYRLLSVYNVENRFYPRALIKQMGLDFEDLISHYADFYGFINLYQSKISSLTLPAGLTYLSRQCFIYDGLYLDTESSKAQTYFYTPAGFYQFTEGSASGEPGSLVMKRFVDVSAITGNQNTGMTLLQLIGFGYALANPVLGSEDMGIMSGDILKAYGFAGLYHEPVLQQTEVAVPVFNKEVLSQIQNATIFRNWLPNSLDVTQTTAINTGFLVSKPQLEVLAGYVNAGTEEGSGGVWTLQNFVSQITAPFSAKALTFDHNDVKPEEVLVASRLAVMGDVITVNEIGNPEHVVCSITPTAVGSEVAVGATISYYTTAQLDQQGDTGLRFSGIHTIQCRTENAIGLTPSGGTIGNYIHVANVAGYLNAVFAQFERLSQFDWAPAVYPFGLFYNPNVTKFAGAFTSMTGYFQDVAYWSKLFIENYDNMHEVAILSEFSVRLN